ncbi:DinB family protein [uncultured Psychromonas sp.]|uniref:DinB family protein n=1 Tax=uncultured Psychromonas sp. TaxID=173974 RepID=UPI0026244F10|nr:DinB family protein [uncultured Psychromonas sp.]
MIESQLIILQQAKTYLTSVSEQQYTQIISPYFMSSAGAHMRHILDHYYAIINGLSEGLIDYDKRSRGGIIESSPKAALQSIQEISDFLNALTAQQLQQTIKLSTEISVTDKQVAIVDTSLAREIIFTGSHAVHHLATIKHIAQAQEIEVEGSLGIAPATATFLRAG